MRRFITRSADQVWDLMEREISKRWYYAIAVFVFLVGSGGAIIANGFHSSVIATVFSFIVLGGLASFFAIFCWVPKSQRK